MSGSLRHAVAAVRRHPVARDAARLGYVASAAVHALVGWAALQLTWAGYEVADRTTGPLRQLAGTAGGGALLWMITAGLCALVLWQLTEAAVRHGVRRRAKPLGRAVVYLALAWVAGGVADGPGDDDFREEDLTAALMQYHGGLGLVAVLGLAVVAMGLYHVRTGWRGSFLRDLHAVPGPWVVRAGRIGYVAKGAALVVGGGLLVAAAAGYRPERAQGLDAALGMILQMPSGGVLLTLMALGFGGYAVYALARARHDWC